MTDEIRCPNCDSPSVFYSESAQGKGPVVCGACGMFLATRGRFRQLLERCAARSGVVNAGNSLEKSKQAR
jgi:transcription elongation factor Elf1